MNRKEFLLKLEGNISLLNDSDNYLSSICTEFFLTSSSPKDFIYKLANKIENDEDFIIALYFAGFLTGAKTAGAIW